MTEPQEEVLQAHLQDSDWDRLGADGQALPHWKQPAMLLLLAFIFLLQCVSWEILEGYQLADSIEYMERAQSYVRGEQVVDSSAIRSYGFIALISPIFALADLIGLEDVRCLVWIVRLTQMALGLALVLTCARIAARLGGYGAGLVAGYVVGINPVFLQYSVSPVSDIAVGVCVGRALEVLLAAGDWKRGLRGGLWLGVGLLMAFKALLIILPVGALLLLRDWRKNRGELCGAAGGLGVCTLVQGSLDQLVYGEWGLSLTTYIKQNIASELAIRIDKIGLHDWAGSVYRWGQTAFTEAAAGELGQAQDAQSLQAASYYLTNMPDMVVWPLIFFGLIGLAHAVRRLDSRVTPILLLFLISAVAMSRKGSKDFRLWLMILPLMAPLIALGWTRFKGVPRYVARWRPLVAPLFLIAAMFTGMSTLMERNTRKYAGYWNAIEYVNERAAELRADDPSLAPVVASSAYHWGVFLRAAPDVDLVKLPHQLHMWNTHDDVERQELIGAVSELDWLVTHLSVLREHPVLMAAVNERFQVEAMFWDPIRYEDIAAVLVLQRKKPGDPGAVRSFFEHIEGQDPEEYRREHLLPPRVDFVRDLIMPDPKGPAGATYVHHEEIALLGWEYEELPGDGHGWITYHWYCATEMLANYTLVDRLTTFDERHSWMNNHGPAYGVHPTQSTQPGGWQPGMILRESYPVVAAEDPFEWQTPFKPMGGPYRRGDLMPASLWFKLCTYDLDQATNTTIETGRMFAARPAESVPIRAGETAELRITPDGWYFSDDNLVRVGRFFLPVHELTRVPDDGRPIPETN